MCKHLPIFAILLAPLLTALADPPLPDVAPGRFKGPLGMAVDAAGECAYVALYDAGSVAVVDLKAGKVRREIAVGAGPWDVALVSDRLVVSCEQDDVLRVIDPAAGKVVATWKTDPGPRGVAVAPDGSRYFVCCHDAQTLQAIDAATGRATSLPLAGWPERVAIHRDTTHPYLLVLTDDQPGATVHLATSDAAPRVLASSHLGHVSNPPGFTSKQGSASFVLLVHQNPRDKVPATQIAQGWVFTNAVSTFSPWGIDTPKGGASPAKVLDEPGRGYADPTDVVLLPNQRFAFVACGGADAVLALRTDRFVSANYGPLVDDGSALTKLPRAKDDLSLSRRYVIAHLPTGANPRRLALSGDGGILVVANHLGDSLTVIDTHVPRVLRQIPLGGAEPDAARRGAILFHSNRMTFHGQFTCASCHPGGGTDGRNWDLSRDGIGNFLNTRSLRGVKDTPPYGWHGTSPDLADRVTGTLRNLHHHEPTAAEVADLVAYLETLRPHRPISPADAAPVTRGKALFFGKAGCAKCHRTDAYDDRAAHDVGTRVDGDVSDRFDTPSLRGVRFTGPYLHHGRAQTLEEVLTTYNAEHRHGHVHELTPAERADLIAFLRSL
jgi:YVTN family beta-propeller protein